VLLLFSGALALLTVSVFFGGPGLASETLDKSLSVALMMACAIYLYAATGAVYDETRTIRILKVVALTVGVAAIVLGYRFALLLITLYSA